MNFRNKLVNPLVRWLLRSPFHSLVSGSLLILTVRGCKSGKAYSLPTQYVRAGQEIIVMVGEPEKKTWWKNLYVPARVQLLVEGRAVEGEAELVIGAREPARVAQAMPAYLERFPMSARLHHLVPAPDGGFDKADLQAVARSMVMVRVGLIGE